MATKYFTAEARTNTVRMGTSTRKRRWTRHKHAMKVDRGSSNGRRLMAKAFVRKIRAHPEKGVMRSSSVKRASRRRVTARSAANTGNEHYCEVAGQMAHATSHIVQVFASNTGSLSIPPAFHRFPLLMLQPHTIAASAVSLALLAICFKDRMCGSLVEAASEEHRSVSWGQRRDSRRVGTSSRQMNDSGMRGQYQVQMSIQ
ncbi:hypothetical protein EDB82DRAFT_555443 [Fusarium venenatum]|uniref:uncharacterized protein n=1 Tax=Fusarium venenatum TaxID=56646 RepID=UPI001D986E0E|nr:hypothetical protein EDB82DRAFT_555443 [Fusarium venenatum]